MTIWDNQNKYNFFKLKSIASYFFYFAFCRNNNNKGFLGIFLHKSERDSTITKTRRKPMRRKGMHKPEILQPLKKSNRIQYVLGIA